MIGWLGAAYPWVKAAHVIVTFFWIAGLLMLPRMLVYALEDGASSAARWQERVRRLRGFILTPAIILVWLLGLATALSYGFAGAGWLHIKILLVLMLSAYHGWAVVMARRHLAAPYDATAGQARRLRKLGEIPAVLLIAVVLLAVVKPF